jgi:hypothetical protein
MVTVRNIKMLRTLEPFSGGSEHFQDKQLYMKDAFNSPINFDDLKPGD